jgi:hypothetical protein
MTHLKIVNVSTFVARCTYVFCCLLYVCLHVTEDTSLCVY